MLLSTLVLNTLLFFSNKHDTVIKKSFNEISIPITIQYSNTSKYNLFVLPGYGFKALDWCTKTSLCTKAKQLGFNLIFIDVQKSLYLKKYSPNTTLSVKKYPTRNWIIDSAIKPLFATHLLNSKNKTFVLGLSTGARGAAILMLENPNVFAAAACLSGDYDPTLQKNDPLMINALGDYSKNVNAWLGDNNITNRAKEFKNPIFIAHGMKDNIVPVKQSIKLKEKLLSDNPELKIQSDFPQNGSHDYAFWDSEIDKLLLFFLKLD